MADSTISNLAAGIQPVDADYFVTVQGGATVKVTAKQLANYAAVAQFSGSSTRYPGDFSNATLALRTLFLSGTVNGNTDVGAIPNGAGTSAFWTAYNLNNPTNAAYTQLAVTPTLSSIAAGANGSGTALPLAFVTGATEVMRGSTSGNLLIGATVDAGTGKVQLTGNAAVVGNLALTGAATVTGNVSAASLNTGPTGGLRNAVTNGVFSIDQVYEGTVATFTAVAALAPAVDGWQAACTGANVTGQRITLSGEYRYKFTGAASVTGITFLHRMLSYDTYNFAGQTATLRAKIASSNLVTITWTLNYATTANAFGSLAAPTKTQIATGTFNIGPGEATSQVQIPIPAGATTGLEIVFTAGALLAGQTLQFGEVGLIRTTQNETYYPYRPKAVELILCQRFTWKTFPQGTVPAQNAGVSGAFTIGSSATSTFAGSFTLPVVMWAAPTTVTTYNPSAANANFRDTNNSADRTLNLAVASDASVNLVGVAGAVNGINRIHALLQSPIP